ncbi:glycerophosphodiester phosphodiesterase [Brucella pseudogrignonensis]|uniref:glycerophosphodiester phosphodiesterase n=1 Tax=Brucella pseudogrignonensis TaxID=419475 RepID=UPI000CFAA455|nr:glycerophosphodiester phosphodiesterase [Brucella pseudogrignonensis]MQP38886.1 glycerophosphodiester phosphodiesterase [Ochrobactrum sp. MYb237]KAB2691700.1 glycerophosphodiester phosphodiesterase [Brucella pseudogrignonensis]PQZ43496.1 glycerophosphodiester phosphodiesterase [Brucella pseudogrignonensis]PRA43243.1 glycerophosphodiester phosphodiesterase [Brucella pseudogrignonensis]PRA72288.1 glycerophosphodiester phosphodiesterase [Brucella pseudogrignonensis]
MSSPEWLKKQPIAHRGLHDLNKDRWENTLAAFDAAAKAGFAIECDVHLTKDGGVIVFHDDDLKRLTGREGRISDLTLAEATELHIGGTADRAPTLKQMLDLIAGRVPVVIELKGIEGRDDGLVAAVAKELASYKGQAAIMSFDHHLVRLFASDAPGIPGGLTAEGTRTKDFEAHFSMLAHQISFVSYNVHHLPNPFVSFAREKLDLPVISWTVRDTEMKKHSDLNVDQITFEGFDPRAMVA